MITESTIINKIFEGCEENGWTILNGLGSGHFNRNASNKSMVAPLIKYLEKNGIEVKRSGKKIEE